MPKIQRKTQKIFCNSADSDQLAVFGSMSTGTPVYSSDIEELQSNEAFDLGWDAATLEDKAPFMEEMNGVQYGLTYQIAYGLQEGIPEYDAATTYYIGSICKVLEDSKPVLYTSLTDNNIGNNPVNDSTNWERLSFGGGGLEIGDIGFTQMAIDETKGLRRKLNGQLIIQDQYVELTNIIKNSVALNPDLACTESEWQTAVAMSTAGICYKFVIDNNAGTIRLPKYPNYLIAGLKGVAPIAGNGMALGLTDGTSNASIYIRNMANLGGSAAMQLSKAGYGTTVGTVVAEDSSWGTNARTTIGVTTDSNYSGIVAQLSNNQTEQIKGTYFIQVATGAETEDNIINEIELNNPFSLLDYKYSEYELNNLSWLRSNGQYNSKAVYPAVYELLLKIYNGTETKAGVSVKLSTGSYTDYDFVLNTSNETFRLPIKVKLASGKAVKGNGMGLGLTNGTRNGGIYEENFTVKISTNTFNTAIGSSVPSGQVGMDGKVLGVVTDPNYSGLELSDSGLYLYFYVGETVQNANLINAGRIEETLAGKLDRSAVKAYIVETYVSGTSGYNLYSNKYCEQWGFLSNTSNATTTVNYIKPFANTNYNLLVSMSAKADGSPTINVGWQSKTATSFVIFTYQSKNNPEGTHWRACGYIA